MHFISYARREFYYTETLVGSLGEQGVPVWFDVNELTVGRDWQADIDRGLQTCTGLILIASRAALASPYVEYEWRAALERGVPVIVVAFGRVTLPPALQAAPTLRAAHAAERLPDVVGGADATEKPAFWMPRAALVVLVTLLLSAAYHIVGAFGVDWAGSISRVMLQVVFASLGVFMLWAALAFFRRQFSYNNLFNGLALFNAVGFVSYTQFLFPQGARLAVVSPVVYALTALLLPLTVLSLIWMRYAYGVLVWTTTGEAPQGLRFRHNPALAKLTRRGERKIRFRLHHHPADAPLAERIGRVLVNAGHAYSADEADYHLVVVSNVTDPEWLAPVLDAHDNVIAIVASSVNVPDSLERLRRYQWVDYRAQSAVQLDGLLAFFGDETGSASSRLLNNVPESMARPVIPASVGWMALILRVGAATVIVVSLIVGLAGAVGLPNGRTAVLLGVAAGLAQMWLAARLIQRKVNRWVFLAVTVGTIALTLTILPEISVIVILYALLFPAAMPSFSGSVPWFPARASEPATATMSSLNPRRLWAVNGAMLLFGVWAAVFVPGVQAAGLLELAAFELGITGYQTLTLEDAISLNAPDYFQIPPEPHTPDHLDDLGTVIWEGRSTTGISAQNSITARLISFEPTTSFNTDMLSTAALLDDNPATLLTTPAMQVNIPTRDPAAAVDHYANNMFRPFIEQRYAGYYSQLIQYEAERRQREMLSDLTGVDDPLLGFMGPPANPSNLLPPPEPSRRVANLVRDDLNTQAENVALTRFRYDIEIAGERTHEWLLTLQTVGADYIVQITGAEADIEWHLSQVEHLIESLAIDESFRTPFERTVTVEDITFTVPTEDLSGMENLDLTAGQIAADQLENTFMLRLDMQHYRPYSVDGERVQISVYTLLPDGDYATGADLLGAVRAHMTAKNAEYTSYFLDARDEEGNIDSSQIVAATRAVRFDPPQTRTGEVGDGVAYEHLTTSTTFGVQMGMSFLPPQRDDIITFEHNGTTYVLWLTGAPDDYIPQLLATIRFGR